MRIVSLLSKPNQHQLVQMTLSLSTTNQRIALKGVPVALHGGVFMNVDKRNTVTGYRQYTSRSGPSMLLSQDRPSTSQYVSPVGPFKVSTSWVGSTPSGFGGVQCKTFSTDSGATIPEGEIDKMEPPEKLTPDVVEKIGEMTHFYIKKGLSQRRLKTLSKYTDKIPVVAQWQKMMEIFLSTQIHVITGFGYDASEKGLQQYALDLAACIQASDPTMQQTFQEMRRDTWKELVSTCFDIADPNDIPSLSIVDARNIMHKVSSKMIEPSVLLQIQTKTAKLQDADPTIEVAKKHQVLQDIIVNEVYLGGDPSIASESGFGAGAVGYAKLQCAMTEHEGDPLIGQYAGAAMVKIWEAAGLDMESLGQAAAQASAQGPSAGPAIPPPASSS